MKSYQSSSHKFFQDEVEAFHALGKASKGIIGYLGDYTVEGKDSTTHNILLEYGDLDLEEYFNVIRPPILYRDIVMFWRNISDVADAIANIHQLTIKQAGVDQSYAGYV